MPFLDGSLEQISASSRTIAELEFPPPKIFTNALLANHEITALIRDTEPHERALFSLDPNNSRKTSYTVDSGSRSQGRKSIFPSGPAAKQSAVARVLGNDMLHEIRQTSGSAARGKGGVNVEVLLRGAERLCDAYSVAGANDKIVAIRRRHQLISASIANYQERVSAQQSRLERFNSDSAQGIEDPESPDHGRGVTSKPAYTEHDFETEEAEVKELEMRKKALEARVAGMEKDLGGLLE